MCIRLLSVKKKDFSLFFQNKFTINRVFYHGYYVSFYAVKESKPEEYVNAIKVGITVSKKTGKAVERNKIKRRLKVLIKEMFLKESNIGFYYIIISRKNIMQASYKDLQKDLSICVKKTKQKVS